MQEMTYLVTVGEYSDYRVLASFGTDRAAAEDFVNDHNARSDWSKATIEAKPVRPAGWRGEAVARAYTWVDSETGDVGEWGSPYSETTEYYDAPTRPTVSRYERRKGPRTGVVVSTFGRPEHVKQAHSDAVAKLRAEIIGL